MFSDKALAVVLSDYSQAYPQEMGINLVYGQSGLNGFWQPKETAFKIDGMLPHNPSRRDGLADEDGVVLPSDRMNYPRIN